MIFIVEDNQEIREMESLALKSCGLEVLAFESASSMDEKLQSGIIPDLFILDIMLPGESGDSILNRLRHQASTKKIPIIMLTAKGNELDKVKCLDKGADDYITKPFGVLEFISRIKALLRRSRKENNLTEKLTYKNLEIDAKKHSININKKSLELTYKEYEILKILVSQPGTVFSRQQILELVWGYDFQLETRAIDMHIKNLRKKISEAEFTIQTIRNVGYKIED